MFRLVMVLAASLWAGAAWAADQPLYAPPPAWVKPIPIPTPTTAPSGDAMAVQVLMVEKQTRFGPDGDEFFSETVFRIVSPPGLAFAGAIAPSWDPQTETLIFHRFNIIRGGQTIDLLAGGKKVTVLRRETNLEMAMLDGHLTASIQPEGLQVGDIVDVSLTLRRHDPVYHDHSEGFDALAFPSQVGRIYFRNLWPASKPIRWKTTDGMPAPAVTRGADGVELVVDLANATAPKPPADAPARFQNLGQMQLSQFSGWPEVSALMAPYYDKAATLAADTPLKQEIQRIRDASPDPKVRAEAALRLVQDKVRYTFIGLNQGGYVPADADTTWTRRFGDCKGKSALLLALLRQLGIEAEPALASTTSGDGMDERLPMLGVFDHVIVRARIGGKTYWLDGTRLGDRALDDIAVPDFHWALPLTDAGADLEKLEPRPLDKPAFESLLRLDVSGGLDAPASAHAEHTLRGDAAVSENLALTTADRAEAERSLREYWRTALSWVDVKSVDFQFDDAHRTMRLTMDGTGAMDWEKNGTVRDFDIADSSLGFRPSFKRDPGLHADAPYAAPFPVFRKWTVVISLPDKGEGFSLISNESVDETIAGRHFLRQGRLENGVATVVASEDTVAPEFPASQADAAATALRQLNAYDVVVRDNGAPLASANVADDDSQLPPPVTAADFAHRGEMYLVSHDRKRAIADFDQATRLDPTVARNFYNRGAARLENGEVGPAIADFTQALRLNPADGLALEGRARAYLQQNKDDLAKKDLDEAARLSANSMAVLSRHVLIYQEWSRYEAAVSLLDQMAAKSPTASLLNNRCWIRAMWGKELDSGLADCDAALKLSPANSAYLDSRAFILLRLGRLADSVQAYDDAIRLSPSQAPSLYGRGLVKNRLGPGKPGADDIAAAIRIEPDVAKPFARIGLTP